MTRHPDDTKVSSSLRAQGVILRGWIRRFLSRLTDGADFDGTWSVESFRRGDEMVPPVPGSDPTLTIGDGKVQGNFGLNRFGGGFDGTFPLPPMATTRMAGPPELMDQETRLLEHLQEADSWVVDGDGMTWIVHGLNVARLHRSGAV